MQPRPKPRPRAHNASPTGSDEGYEVVDAATRQAIFEKSFRDSLKVPVPANEAASATALAAPLVPAVDPPSLVPTVGPLSPVPPTTAPPLVTPPIVHTGGSSFRVEVVVPTLAALRTSRVGREDEEDVPGNTQTRAEDAMEISDGAHSADDDEHPANTYHEESSDGDHSDFEETMAIERDHRNQIARMRRVEPEDTEREDEEDDLSLQDDAIDEKTGRKCKRSRTSPKSRKRRAKGKGKARVDPLDDPNLLTIESPPDDQVELVSDAEDPFELKPGPLPDEVQLALNQRVQALTDYMHSIARTHGKDYYAVARSAGLLMPQIREPNPANLFSKWFSRDHPKPSLYLNRTTGAVFHRKY